MAVPGERLPADRASRSRTAKSGLGPVAMPQTIEPETTIQFCPYCQSQRINVVPSDAAPSTAFQRCADCSRQLGFCPCPPGVVWANRLILWFGKHKNMSIFEIYQADPGYLKWLAFDGFGAPRKAARLLLHLPAE
jgi:hypothetical protein